jgi:ElaB/YqjD/DUF883 family membrane-anchored ribosome-binding protein
MFRQPTDRRFLSSLPTTSDDAERQPTADSSHKSTTQVPASRTPVEKGEGRVSTSVSSEHLPGGGPSSLHADSHEHAGDASVGEGSENRGLGNFRPKAEVEGAAREAGSKVQDAASKAGDKLSEAASQAGSKVEEVKGKAGSKVEELKEKASDLASKASDKFEEVKSKVSGSVDQAKNQAGDAASSASDAVDGVKAKAQEAGQEAKQSAKELAQEVAKEGVKVAGGEALRRMGIPSVSAAMEALPKEDKFEYEDRQLNQAEQRGLYVLAGTVVGGYLLSRLFAPKTTAGPQVAHHDKH